MSEIAEIHSPLIRGYDRVLKQACQDALDRHAGESLEMLTVLREEITASPGKLTIKQRAWMHGTQAALDELIERKSLEPPIAAE